MILRNLCRRASYLLLALPFCANAELPRLTVSVVNVSPPDGIVEVSVFNSTETFMKQPYLQQSGRAGEDGRFETVFAGMLEGEYAIVVVHDANENEVLDKGFLGFGGESYGWSNNVSPWFGWPDFDDASFTVGAEGANVEIDLD